MKKAVVVCRVILCFLLASLVIGALCRYLDYRAHPAEYAVQSAPWYFPVLLQGAVTAVFAAVCVILTLIFKKKSAGSNRR